MISVKKEFNIPLPLKVVVNYFMKPENIMKFIPYFKDIKEIDENTFSVVIKWLFSVTFLVKRFYNPFTNDIVYKISRSGILKVNATLYHSIFRARDSTKVIISFTYEGPFESLVKREAEKFMIGLSDEVVKEVLRSEEFVIEEGSMERFSLDRIMEMIRDRQEKLKVFIIHKDKIITIYFEKGNLKTVEGDLSSLYNEKSEGKISFLITRNE
ncbi:hypothetical protein WIW90_07380 [Sulfolobaceae archaeon RB850M]